MLLPAASSYKGIAESRSGPISAIVLSSVAWALLHAQYDRSGIAPDPAGGRLYLSPSRFLRVTHFVARHSPTPIGTLELVVQVKTGSK